MTQRHSIIPASYLLFEKDNKILLMRRFNTGFEDGNYAFPSGHVEQGETFTQCAIREAKEEVDVDIEEKELELVHMMHRRSTYKNEERIDAFFIVKKWSGELRNAEPDKCDDLSWFEKEKLPENLIVYLRDTIKSIEKKEFYSQWGWD